MRPWRTSQADAKRLKDRAMIVLLFIVHVAIAVSLIGVILLQKSEGGALGMGGGGMSGFMTGRSTANLLTRTTAFLAIGFFLTSVLLVWLSNSSTASRSLVDQGSRPATQESPAAPIPPPAPAAPAAPAEPSAPLAK
jgi:preprotein translocase subunit SecG